MSAKEEIALLEQKVDILYNIVLSLASTIGTGNITVSLIEDLMHLTHVPKLTTNELDNLAK